MGVAGLSCSAFGVSGSLRDSQWPEGELGLPAPCGHVASWASEPSIVDPGTGIAQHPTAPALQAPPAGRTLSPRPPHPPSGFLCCSITALSRALSSPALGCACSCLGAELWLNPAVRRVEPWAWCLLGWHRPQRLDVD